MGKTILRQEVDDNEEAGKHDAPAIEPARRRSKLSDQGVRRIHRVGSCMGRHLDGVSWHGKRPILKIAIHVPATCRRQAYRTFCSFQELHVLGSKFHQPRQY
ncbi:MAG TPA: hypothetical protein VJR87_05535, partial [Allosphingosinicella sp.]|nr:hypothetical protein [Allosphingosinicella sp.]